MAFTHRIIAGDYKGFEGVLSDQSDSLGRLWIQNDLQFRAAYPKDVEIIAPTKEDTEEGAETMLIKLMQDNPVKIIKWLVLQAGRECVAANATTLDMSMEADIDGHRYKITNKIRIKKMQP